MRPLTNAELSFRAKNIRILLANYRYFVSGGPERYLFNISDALTSRGHHVIPFSIRYRQNVDTPYAGYFAEPIAADDEVYFRDQGKTPRVVIRTLSRLVYSSDIERSIDRLCDYARPDVAYVLHYLRKLSPSLLVGLKRRNIPIVVRLSDYGMICPQAHMLRDATPCNLCVGGSLLPSVQHRCVHGSLVSSAVNAAATWFHRRKRYFDLIDRFVVTNAFMQQQMLDAGFSSDRIALIPTFVNSERFCPGRTKADYIAYVGRLEPMKGVHVLLDAMATLDRTRKDIAWSLKVAATGDGDYERFIKARSTDLGLSHRVEFVGNLNEQQLPAFIANARLQVIPSLWYENLPNAMLEAFACGTPVIASDIGSLKDAVSDGLTGFSFTTGDSDSLASAIARAADCPERELQVIAQNARRLAETDYSTERHLQKIEELLLSVQNVKR